VNPDFGDGIEARNWPPESGNQLKFKFAFDPENRAPKYVDAPPTMSFLLLTQDHLRIQFGS